MPRIEELNKKKSPRWYSLPGQKKTHTKHQTLLIQDNSRLFVSRETKRSPFTPAATRQAGFLDTVYVIVCGVVQINIATKCGVL